MHFRTTINKNFWALRIISASSLGITPLFSGTLFNTTVFLIVKIQPKFNLTSNH